jgi:outer membrane protein OmpU
MNKLKTIGISALAGSLVAFSAQAVEMAVSGSAEITSTHKSTNEVTGNPYGTASNVTFTASGELDIGVGITAYTALGATGAFTSSQYSFDLGSMGTLTVNQGSTAGAGTIDNVMPTAYEEADAGFSTGMIDIGGSATGTYFGYSKSLDTGGVTIGGAYSPGPDGGTSGPGSVGGGSGATAYDMFITASPVDGLNVGFGVGQQDNAGAADADERTMHVTYAMGSVTVGVMRATDETSGGTEHNSAGFGISANVTDDLSVSYQYLETEYDATTGADIVAEFVGLSAAYSMGNMSIRFFSNEAENVGGSAANDDSQSELSLSFSF